MKRYNGRCKGCKQKVSTLATRAENVRLDTGWTFAYQTSKGDTLYGHRSDTSIPIKACPACGKRVLLRPVSGKVNRAIRCDARCENAIGHKCECACGGRNHGASYS